MNPEAYIELDKTESSHWWFVARRMILATVIKKFNLPHNAKILEIGCGTGGNLKMLSQFGRVSGVDMDKNAIQIALQKNESNFDIRLGNCPNNMPFEGQKFDLICMFDVLEHIEEDVDTLKLLKNLLTDNGKILISVPAYQWLWGAHDDFLHHKRRYTLKQLSEKINKSGLTVLMYTYFNTFLFPFIALMRLKEKVFKNSDAIGRCIPSPFLNFVCRTIFSIEMYFLSFIKFSFGLSIMVVLYK